MKRIITCVMAIILLLCVTPEYSATCTDEQILYGDCNTDSFVNAKDVLVLRRFLVNLQQLTDIGKIAADINRDGKQNAKDVLHLRRYLAGIADIENGKVFYVSKNGSDNNNGTLSQPFLTIQRAAQVMSAGDLCYIREGIYRETVKPAQSGKSGAPITFAAYENERVVVSGAEQINTQWSEYRDGIYKTDIRLWRNDENLIFVNGEAATLCRYPNKDSPKILDIGNTVSATDASDSFANADIPFDDGELVGAKIAIEGTDSYIFYSSEIKSNSGKKLEFNKLDSGWDSPKSGSDFYLYDRLCLLDEAGEWYYGNGTLYYKPSDSVNINDIDIEYSVRGQAFDVSGKSDITIRGVEIFGATVRTDTNSKRLTLDNNRILYFYHSNVARSYPWEADWWGIELHGSNSVVKNCEIAYGAEGGVIIYADDCSIVNNYIHDINYINSNASAVHFRRGKRTLISHNTIIDIARSGINCDGKYMRICYNDISRCGVNTNDVSGIGSYKFDAENTVEIDHNIIHDTKDGRMFTAYYLDNGSLNFTVHHNLAYKVDSAMIINNPAYSNKIYNNTFADCGPVCTGNLQDPFNNNDFIGSVWTGSQFYNNIMPSIYYGHGASFGGNLFCDNPDLEFRSRATGDYSISESSAAAHGGVNTALDSNGGYIGAFAPGDDKWRAGCDWSAEYPESFSLSTYNPDFVPIYRDVFEEIKSIGTENMLSSDIFRDNTVIKQGWREQSFDVKPGEIYYIACEAAFNSPPKSYLEFGVHFCDIDYNIQSQGSFLYTQSKMNLLQTLIIIPQKCVKLRYFASVWADEAVTAGKFRLIKLN